MKIFLLLLFILSTATYADTLTCFKNTSGQYSEYPVLLGRGHDSSNDLDWGRGGGCILRPISQIWNATQKDAFMLWDGVTSITSKLDPIPTDGLTRYFNVNYVVHNSWPLPQVQWNMDWNHLISRGTSQNPTQITIMFNKTTGTSHITKWQGYIILDEVAPGIISFESLNQVKATQTNAEDAANGVMDLYLKAQNL